MGSLPNLNELHREKIEKRAEERERELAREAVIDRDFPLARDTSYGRERLPTFIHQIHMPHHHHQQHHRHSLTSRKVLRTRSTGATHHIWDDPMIEQMEAYSPISYRSHRMGMGMAPLPPHSAPTSSMAYNRRRESINSSIGATSVRRLLAVNRSYGCRHKIPVHVRAKITKHFILLVVAHAITCSALVPFIGLQGSNSTWYQQDSLLPVGPDIGSILFSFCFFITSGMCLLTTRIIRKFGFIILIATSYGGFCLFLSTHLYPSIYLLLPGYVILGLTLGPAWVSKLTLVVSLANKISCSQPECGGASYAGINADSFDEHKLLCNREESIRRLSRWYHAAQDFGIIIGAVIASIVLTCASSSRAGCLYSNYSQQISTTTATASSTEEQQNNNITLPITEKQYIINLSETNFSALSNLTLLSTASAGDDASSKSLSAPVGDIQVENKIKHAYHSRRLNQVNPVVEQQSENQHDIQLINKQMNNNKNNNSGLSNEIRAEYFDQTQLADSKLLTSERFLYNMFEINDHGERICGSHLCPVWKLNQMISDKASNTTTSVTPIKYSGATPLVCVYLVMSVIAVTVTALTSDVDNFSHHMKFDLEHVKGMTDTLMFAGPLALFTGVEYGYLLTDFTKAFVSCALGPHMVASAFVGMGIMQLIASATLSMLLRHTKRIVVIAVGFLFHACLLLVLSRWKPSTEDSAILYVIPASWGVCNAVWETLLFALITLTHPNHVAEIASPMQALKFFGLGLTFAAHGILCEGPKILILAILLVFSVIPYTMLEIKLEGQRKLQMTHL